MIRVLRNLRSRGWKGFETRLELLLIVALIVFTILAALIMLCPSVDWCFNKMLTSATVRSIVQQ